MQCILMNSMNSRNCTPFTCIIISFLNPDYVNKIIVLFSKLLDEPTVCSIATNYNKSTAQVLLKWALQHDVGE